MALWVSMYVISLFLLGTELVHSSLEQLVLSYVYRIENTQGEKDWTCGRLIVCRCSLGPEYKLILAHGTATCFQPQLGNQTLCARSLFAVVEMKWNSVDLLYRSLFELMVKLTKHDGACCYRKGSMPWCVIGLGLFSCNSTSSCVYSSYATVI